MYDLGNYPGIQLTGTAKFVGDLFSIDDSLVLSVLDEFEGYFPRSPDQSLYIRKQISIQDSTQPVWIYEYNQSVSGLSIIPHGDWVHYWAQKNGQLF